MRWALHMHISRKLRCAYLPAVPERRLPFLGILVRAVVPESNPW